MMAVHAQENPFQPSSSWMSRAGVMVEYSPEDTFKSLIERGFIDNGVGNDDEDSNEYEKILSSNSYSDDVSGWEQNEECPDEDVPHDEKRVVGCVKSFEAMIEEQMLLENEKATLSANKPKKKQTFLKRGEGIARFTTGNNRKLTRKSEGRQSKGNNQISETKNERPPQPPKKAEVIKQLKRHVSVGQKDPSPMRKRTSEPPSHQQVFKENAENHEQQNSNDTSGKSNEEELEVFELFERYADSSFESSISSIARLDKDRLIKKINQKQSRPKDILEIRSPEKPKSTENGPVMSHNGTESTPFTQPRQSMAGPQQNCRFPYRSVPAETVNSQHNFKDDQAWDESADDHGTTTSEDCSQNQSVEYKETRTPEKIPEKPKEKEDGGNGLQNVISNISEAVFPRFSAKVNTQMSENSKLLVEKLAELERDYSIFAREKKALTRQKKEIEEERRQLKADVAQFEKQNAEKMAEINAFKDKETKRLRKERKTLEEYERVMKNGLNRENRQELETLKNRLTEVYEEMSRRENKFQSAQSRMRDRIAALEKERDELREQVHNLEAIRVDLQSKVISSQPTAFSIAKKIKQPLPSTRTSAQPAPQETEENTFQRSKGLQFRQNDSGEPTQRPWDAYQQTGASLSSSGAWQPRQRQSAPTATQYMTPFPASEVSSTLTSSSYNSGGKSQPAIVRMASNEGGSGSGREGGKSDEKLYPDGKIEKINSDGSRVVRFPNGTVKEVSADKNEVVKFFNGDIKRMSADKRIIYYYSETQTTHTTFPDGMETMQFPNGQKEVIYPDQTREIVFPDGVRKYIYPNKTELSMFPSGMIVKVMENGDKEINFTNGQREILTKAFKRREYPDGTTKTLYPDGRQETRYSSGRIRVKDKNGQILENRKCSPVRTSSVSER